MLPELEDIARKRKKMGIRQAELARMAGVSQSLIAKLEAGRIDPSYSNTRAILDALERMEEKEETRAKDIMTRKLSFVAKGDRVADAIRVMKNKGISQVPVLEGDNAVGTVSEGTMTERMGSGMDLTTLSKSRVSEVMDDPPPRVDEETPLAVLNELLRYSPAVLIVKKEKIVGIVTKADLLKAIHK